MGQLSEAAAVRRLGDRLGFGLAGSELSDAQAQGFAATLRRYLSPPTPDAGVAASPAPDLPWIPRPGGTGAGKPSQAERQAWRQQMRQQQAELVLWWLDRMVRADDQLRERMTWFWHGHFATSSRKVRTAVLMLRQNETFRRLGLGPFPPLAHAMIIDPAMLVWLDGNDNTSKAPNENLSREFMELFTLGQGHYTEDDVKQAARALTGWRVKREDGSAVMRPKLHDSGGKHILGEDGDFDAASFVEVIMSRPDCANFVIFRIWYRLVSTTTPDPAAMDRLRQAYGAQGDITALLRAIAAEPAFSDTANSMVKQPVEWTVGLLRALSVRPSAWEDRPARQLAASLRGMGQLPFLPPSVGGWPAAGGWLTTAAALSRVEAARLIAAQATLPAEGEKTPTRFRVEYVRRLLGVDKFSARSADAIAQVADRLPLAVAVAACTPEYVVSR